MTRLIAKLHELGMSEADIQEFVKLKQEINVLWDKPGFYTGSNRRARNTRYDKQAVILERYR